MYLKKMEMKGFKSFADKTIIDFKSGISCIIGPNGSGKSNITDALRWVLGEQKISLLRGSSMKDVIFKGSAHRKPLGRAEISLFFDNSENFFNLEYETVKITRRLFMSGESEYLINNTKTRLRDIRELIMDTGIGSDGYSIVSQGKINTMITANKDDIRAIFEEAAGITKFKTRKKKSEKKLDNTTVNLERIEDIVFELEKRVLPLKKESEKAIKYKKLYKELKSIELATFSKKIKTESLKEKLYNKKITDLFVLKDHKKNMNNTLKNNFEVCKNDIISEDELINKVEKKYYELNDNISLTNNDYNISKERIENIKKGCEDLKNEVIDLEEKLSDYGDLKDKFSKDIKEVKEKINSKNESLELKEKDLKEKSNSVESILDKNREINKKLLVLDRQKEKNITLIDSKKEKISEYEEMIDSLNLEMDSLKTTNNSNLDLRTKINNQIDEISNQIILKTNTRKENLSGIENLENKIQLINNKKEDVLQKLNKEYAEYKLLKNYEENFKGYYYSVKQLMTSIKNTELENGVHGVVASLMTIQKDYETAIEITLGSAMQNVVCDDVNCAKSLINHLKKNKFGRVSFLPLSNLFNRSINNAVMDEVKKFKNFIGRANEIISFDKKYSNLFNYLLGNVLVVKDYDTAKEMLKINNIRYKIVTLEGEVFSPGGRITGGSYKSKSKGLLGRKRKIEKMASSIKEGKVKKEECELKLIDLNKEIKIKKEDFNFMEKSINDLKNQGFELKSKLNYLNEKLTDYDNDKKKKNKRLNDLNEKINNNKEIINKLEKENLNIDEDEKNLNKELKADDYLAKFKKNVKDINSEVNNLKIEIAALNEKQDNYIFNKKNTIEDIQEVNKKIEAKNSLLKQFKKNLKIQKDKSLVLKEKISELEDLKKIQFIKLEDTKKKLKLLEEKMYNTEKKIELNSDELTKINNKLSNYKIEKAKIDISINNIKDDLWQKYEVSYIDALNYKYDKELLVNHSTKLKELRKEIKKLGSVNLNAIDEYDEVKERYEELSNQSNDLKKAKKSLEKIIKDLEKKMKNQFSNELESISKYFKEVFVVLFNGGEADIILEEPDNVLESEIKIMAKPPGKKLQTLDLLSGGEKALTAISLLFAIIKNKPTPFCVLDEIEAALDDVNVFRFADYLKNIVNDSQFIVITHRKGTMEIADCLYGVTMEEKGVSKIVSLKLEDIEKEIV